LIIFEVAQTWRKSKFAKLLIVIILTINIFTIVTISTLWGFGPQSDEFIRDSLNGFISNYLSFGDGFIVSTTEGGPFGLGFSMNLGVLLIAVFGIAGSSLFADDISGKVIEIYLSRLQKKEYVIGKIGAIILYINIFVMIPLLVMGIFFVQALGMNHLEYLGFFWGIILFSLLSSVILGLFILSLSISVEKRTYANLIFFLTFIFGSIIGLSIAMSDFENELLFLISPSNFLVLLSYVCLGDLNLGFNGMRGITPLILNDGVGLEAWHVLLQAFILILVFSLYLAFKIKKMTTEKL
jgi:ABC-type transport system involved in multi-copper enzyme maturation permease subunit